MREMAALTENALAPDFKLKNTYGKEFSLKQSLSSGPVLLMFYKTDCPTCQYAMPYLDRLADKLVESNATAVTVSQDTQSDSDRFSADFKFKNLQVFDTEESNYAVSDAYGLTNVPTVFLIKPDGHVAHTMVSWSKSDVEEIARKLSISAPFHAGEDVLEFKPG